MKGKQLLLFALLISASFAQATSLKDFIKGSSSNLPENCVEASSGSCTKCASGYEVSKGACVKVNLRVTAVDPTIDDSAPAADAVPCGKDESCGEAKNFKSQQEFQDFLDKYTQKQQPQPDYFLPSMPAMNVMSLDAGISGTTAMPAAMQIKPAPLPAVNPKNDFSGTNNQVNGVDEADLLKTDGTYIYTISNQVLSIILAYPSDQARVTSKLNFKDFNPSAIFIEGDYLAVFGTKTTFYNTGCDYPYPYPMPYINGGVVGSMMANAPTVSVAPAARLLQTDLKPSLTATAPSVSALKIAPSIAPSIMPIRPPYRPCLSYSTSYTYIKIYDVSNRGRPTLLKEFQVAGSYYDGRKLDNGFMYLITSYSFNYLPKPLPWYDFGFGPRDVDFRSIFWYPIKYSNPTAVNIVSFNLGNPLGSNKKVVTICAEYTNVMYMSERHIYLTTSNYENGDTYTSIRKIYVWGSYIKPFADGKVRGSVNNQFSIDEYGSFLRIATTSNEAGTTYNNVYVLNYYLKPYGELTGLAKGERIFSARYVGLRLYLVTFRQIDPFYVISFKNHKKPIVLGELKITGFSKYLHPYDDNTIIGLGRQADQNGRQLGLKISLFDVTDVNNPVETTNFEIEERYASSNAEWEHKAFLFEQNKDLLVIPANMDYSGTKFNGALAFYITKNKIILRSIIDHFLNPSDNFWQRNVERSLYINDLLYTKSQCLLRINKINKTFDGVKNIDIPCDQKEFDLPIRPLPIIDPIIIAKPFPPKFSIDPPRLDITAAKVGA